MKTLTIVVALSLLASMALADTLINRYEYAGGQEGHTMALITPEFELWGFNLDNQKKMDLEFGKEFQVSKELKAGGYLAYLPGSKDLDIVPSACYKGKAFGGTLSIHAGVYTPLNGGKVTFYSRETSLTYKVSKGLEAGVAATYWHTQGNPESVQAGLMARKSMGDATVKVRWLAKHNRTPEKWRLETCLNF